MSTIDPGLDSALAEDAFVDIERRFQAMQHASRHAAPIDETERRALLERLRDVVATKREDFIAAISADFGTRARQETLLADIVPSLILIADTLHHLRSWMRPEKRTTAVNFWPGYSRVHYQPKGVVLIVVPWNYPLSLTMGPLTAALAAGNRVIIKPSEFTPRTASAMKRHLEAALGAEHVTVAIGGTDMAAALTALPFDHILYTGSTAVGRKVMAAAAANLTPVTLELGGKSPAILHEDCDLPQAVSRIARGKLLNAGQTCIAPDYMLVPKRQTDAFVKLYQETAASFYPRLVDNPQYSAVINVRHYDRLIRYVADARAKGAHVLTVDPARELPAGEVGSSNTRKIAPVLLTGVNDTMAVMQEEIFGPLLPIVPYETLDDAITYVNARPRPLALYYFDRDRGRIDHVLKRTVSGGVTINDTTLHFAQESLPFGGVGPSGMGAYHGREGFLAFSHAKATFVQGRFTLTGLLNPPYGARFDRLIRFALRRTGAK